MQGGYPPGTPLPLGMIYSQPAHSNCLVTGGGNQGCDLPQGLLILLIRESVLAQCSRIHPNPLGEWIHIQLGHIRQRDLWLQGVTPSPSPSRTNPEWAQREWLCLADVVTVSCHSLGAEAAAAPTAHPLGADPKELAKEKWSEIMDLGMGFFSHSSLVSASKMSQVLSHGMEGCSLG